MPYIKKEDRIKFDKVIELITKLKDDLSEGDLNYLFTSIVKGQIKKMD